MSDPYPALWILLPLLLIDAVLAAGSTALKEINRAILNKKVEEGDKKALQIDHVLNTQNHFSAALEAGRFFCEISAAAVALLCTYSPLKQALTDANFILPSFFAALIPILGIAAIFLPIGEFYASRAAEQKADTALFRLWNPLRLLAGIFLPFAAFANGAASLFLKITGMQTDPDGALSKEELQTLVEESGDSGLLQENERDMLEGIFDFTAKTADEVMTPRTDLYLIDADRPLSEYVEEMLNEKYSRVPVYRGEIDNVIGILYLKDFLCEAYRVGFENVDIERCMHDAYFVPEHKRIDALYRDLQASKNHMAVLIDEYGGISGVVTMEDLIEEVMGDIDDEYDENEDAPVRKESDGSWIADGSATISELNEFADLNLDEESEDYDTVGGLIIKLIGYIPAENETVRVEYAGCEFDVLNIADNRILSVKIRKNNGEIAASPSDKKGSVR